VVVTAAADKEGRDGARGGRLTGKWKEPVVCKIQAGLGSQERAGLYGLEFSFRPSLIMETEVSGLYVLKWIVFDLGRKFKNMSQFLFYTLSGAVGSQDLIDSGQDQFVNF
jgi:hypothetical protein